MGRIERLWRYDGRRALVTGCASGIGAQLVGQLTELGAEVIGVDRADPAGDLAEFHRIDLADPVSVDRAVAALNGPVDALFNVAGVSSGIGDPALVVTVNFLGLRHLTEAVVATMPSGSSVVSVSSLAASGYQNHREEVAGLRSEERRGGSGSEGEDGRR